MGTKSGISFECACWEKNEELKKEICQKYEFCSCPMIFLNGKFIGGYHELKRKLGEEEKVEAGLTMETIKESAKKGANKAKEGVKFAKYKTLEKTGVMKDKTSGATNNASGKGESTKDKVVGKAGEMKDATKEAAQ